MPKLQIDIKCGETTCATVPGVFCRFLGSRKFGQIPTCTLFPSKEGSYTHLQEMDGWARRLPECIAAEKGC